MSITQTFYLAHQARGKLASEAAKHDHELRMLVGHANLLDRLMLHLSQAEQEQDAWFNTMVRGNSADEEEAESKVAAFETIQEEPEIGWLAEDYSDSESDSDDDEEEENYNNNDFTMFPTLAQTTLRKVESQPHIQSTAMEVDAEYDSDEEEEDSDGFYALSRTTSYRPPSLVDDSSDSDEEDSNPPSPPQPTLAVPRLSEKQRKQLVTTSFYDDSEENSFLEEEGFYLQQPSNMITAY